MSDGYQLLLDWLLSHLVDMQIGALQALATLCWWAAKLANVVATFLVEENLWDYLLDSLLAALVAAAPDLFATLIFAPTGLFYIALSLAGILLILGGGARNLAEPAQVMLWGALVATLFVSTTLGYDLIAALEEGRRWAAHEAATVVAPSGSLSDLITTPMRATTAEAEDLAWTLPAQFTDDFFYPAADFTTESALLFDSWFTGEISLELTLEEEGAQETRRQAAWQGLLLATLTLAPAALAGMFGAIFATLGATVLVLLLFFIAALPLGFFAFGRGILESLARQYAFLWALTLAAAVLIGLLLGTGDLFLPAAPDLEAIAGYLPLLVIVAVAVTYLLKLTARALQGTLGLVTATVRATVTAEAQNTRAPDAGDVPLAGRFAQAYGAAQQLAGLAAVGTAAAATGGSSLVLPALAGSGLSRTDPATGRDAAVLARISSDSPAARTFAAAAVSGRTLPAVAGVWAVSRRDKEPEPEPMTAAGPRALARGVLNPSAAPDHTDPMALGRLATTAQRQGLDEDDLATLFAAVRRGLEQGAAAGIEAGVAVATALDELDEDESETLAGLPPAARGRLGRQATAVTHDHHNRLLAWLALNPEQQPLAWQPRLRGLHSLAATHELTPNELARFLGVARQALADETATGLVAEQTLTYALGQDRRGRALPEAVQTQLARALLAVLHNRRQPTPDGPLTPGTLARWTRQPQAAPAGSDVAALYRVRQTAERAGWDDDVLGRVYAAAQQGVARAAQDGTNPQQAVYEQVVAGSAAANRLAARDRVALARNAMLVAQSVVAQSVVAQSLTGQSLTPEAAAAGPPGAVGEEERAAAVDGEAALPTDGRTGTPVAAGPGRAAPDVPATGREQAPTAEHASLQPTPDPFTRSMPAAATPVHEAREETLSPAGVDVEKTTPAITNHSGPVRKEREDDETEDNA